jgi:hypothetical protein
MSNQPRLCGLLQARRAGGMYVTGLSVFTAFFGFRLNPNRLENSYWLHHNHGQSSKLVKHVQKDHSYRDQQDHGHVYT